jgi:hypothetical protein
VVDVSSTPGKTENMKTTSGERAAQRATGKFERVIRRLSSVTTLPNVMPSEGRQGG